MLPTTLLLIFLWRFSMVLFTLGVLRSLLQPVIDHNIINLMYFQINVEVLVNMET